MMKQVTCPKCKGKKAIKKRLGSAIEFTLCGKCEGKGEIAVPYTKEERVTLANQFIETIASHGRKFFAHNGRVSQFVLDENGRTWFVDAYNMNRIYVAYNGRWRGFTEGGTLRSLVQVLYKYIKGDIFSFNLEWPAWYSGGDPWGYKDDMDKVREASKKLVL